ncbi:molybdopterin converting factor subunit 1 [Hyphomicrobium sp.]|uniref:molybdopterin converting factor subunit 1 n=1 Tax=Hyphomicrobium sp. TaxID=82 RepID=UPI001D4ACE42|nr:molybdopterin converting factor subunit 1 [Hyphomicrobium sp.]MBY0558833.1 molybdopterin converting factor subunit 1 [Hyphomicrobium sp.]
MTEKQSTGETVLRYFAWLRERTGLSEERLILPADILTVNDLLLWQSRRGHPFDQAFAKPEAIRVAIDHSHAKPAAEIGSAREIAFFPPVTGG